MAAEPTSDTTASFEAVLRGLEGVVERLEGGDLSLEDSLAAFEEGIRLARLGTERLDAAERRVEELLADGTAQPLSDAAGAASPPAASADEKESTAP
ncbi:MAG: exodeoxyribonuclease VII small subunit [Myxococcota bacterium]